MPEYLYVIKHPDGWTLATRGGHLTTVPESELPADAPRMVAHPRSAIPTMPLMAEDCACCAALAQAHQEALADELAAGGQV